MTILACSVAAKRLKEDEAEASFERERQDYVFEEMTPYQLGAYIDDVMGYTFEEI